MNPTLIFLLFSLIYLTGLTHGQKITAQYAFREIEIKNAAQQFNEPIQSLVTNNNTSFSNFLTLHLFEIFT
jgi:hypothetical protein